MNNSGDAVTAKPETVRELALALPTVVERLCYGTPGFYVRKKIFARLLEDGDSVVVRVENDRRAVLMKSNPQSFYITDHYRNYPMLIVRLSTVDPAELHELLKEAWQLASA